MIIYAVNYLQNEKSIYGTHRRKMINELYRKDCKQKMIY